MSKKGKRKTNLEFEKFPENHNTTDEQYEFDPNDPRGRYLRKLRRVWLSSAILGMLSIIVGVFAPDEWKTDIGILCFILVALCTAYFLYYDYLAKKWGMDERNEDE